MCNQFAKQHIIEQTFQLLVANVNDKLVEHAEGKKDQAARCVTKPARKEASYPYGVFRNACATFSSASTEGVANATESKWTHWGLNPGPPAC